jgi:hypothetical protein
MKIIQEFYSLQTKENAEKWVKEDILENYGTDYRVHIVRLSAKSVDIIQKACICNGIDFMNHNSSNRLSPQAIKVLFKDPLTKHIVLGVKGFFRRANLIPNCWKLRIGATHELYTKLVDNNVQVQGLPGRMTGYWRAIIEGGHKTGPHRTSIKAIEEYEETYINPLGLTSYQTNGFKKNKDGKVSAQPTMLSVENIANLEPIDLPVIVEETIGLIIKKCENQEEVKDYIKATFPGKIGPHKVVANEDGYFEATIRSVKKVWSCLEVQNERKGGLAESTYRVRPCYEDINDKSTLQWWVIHYNSLK